MFFVYFSMVDGSWIQLQTKEADRFQGLPGGFHQEAGQEQSASADRKPSPDRRLIKLAEEALSVRCQGLAPGELVKAIDDKVLPSHKVHSWPGCRVAVKLTDAPRQVFPRMGNHDEDRAAMIRRALSMLEAPNRARMHTGSKH